MASQVIDFINIINHLFSQYIAPYYHIACILVILLTAFTKDAKKHLTLKLDKVAKFIAFMGIITAFRYCIINDYTPLQPELINKKNDLIFVGLEDVFFVFIPILLTRFINIKPINFVIWILFTMFFAFGHVYQGLGGVLITALYPYFISRKYILKVGLTTVMVCHFLYDVITIATIQIINILYII